MRSSPVSLSAPLVIALLLVAMSGLASAGTYINFSYPGASATSVTCVNNKGDAVGGWSAGGNPVVGGAFLRQANGTFYSIAISGAIQIGALGVNDSGQVVGYYLDQNVVAHGYLRNLAGQFTTLNAPGAGWGRSYTGTYALAINDSGEIAGFYVTEQQVQHGFIRDAAGNYTTFDPPGSTGTYAGYINQSSEIAGTFSTSTTQGQGYLRDALGNITTFTVPGSTTRYGVRVTGLNTSGEISGGYANGLGYGFLRDASGNITSFTLPLGGAGGGCTVGMQDDGDIIGQEQNPIFSEWGFRRTPAGVITSFADPASGTYPYTYPVTVSGNGNIGGYYYVDGSYADAIAFVWLPN